MSAELPFISTEEEFVTFLDTAPAGARCVYFRGPHVDSSRPGIARTAMMACDCGDVFLVRRRIGDRVYEFIAERCRRPGLGRSLADTKRIIDRGEENNREAKVSEQSTAQDASGLSSVAVSDSHRSRLTTAKDRAEQAFRAPDAPND